MHPSQPHLAKWSPWILWCCSSVVNQAGWDLLRSVQPLQLSLYGALEGLGVHPIALHPMENPMVRSLQRHSYPPSLLFSWCPMLVPSTVYRITDYLCLLHRSSKMVTFGGQVLSGGLEMSSSAWCISQWWMSGLCWAAEKEAGAASSSPEEPSTG